MLGSPDEGVINTQDAFCGERDWHTWIRRPGVEERCLPFAFKGDTLAFDRAGSVEPPYIKHFKDNVNPRHVVRATTFCGEPC